LLLLNSQQTPNKGEVFLDHVGWYVPNLDEVVASFSRLGFVVTPYSVHGDRDPNTGDIIPQGSANRLVMLESGYLEFLTVVDGTDTPVSRHLEDRMDKYIGVHLVAFTVADAEAEASRITGEGIDLQPTVNLRRTIEAEDGSEVAVAFSVVRARFDLYPEGRVQTLTHHTPEHVWQDRYITRDNGICGLNEVVYAVPNPTDSAGRFAQFTGRPQTETKIGTEIILDRGKLTFATSQNLITTLGISVPDHLPSIAAIGLVSQDFTQTISFLKDRKIDYVVWNKATLVIAPQEALGVTLIISVE
jgi:hypothetical protein